MEFNLWVKYCNPVHARKLLNGHVVSYSFLIKILNILIYHNISIFDNDRLLSSVFRQKQRLWRGQYLVSISRSIVYGKCACLQLHFWWAGVGTLSIWYSNVLYRFQPGIGPSSAVIVKPEFFQMVLWFWSWSCWYKSDGFSFGLYQHNLDPDKSTVWVTARLM